MREELLEVLAEPSTGAKLNLKADRREQGRIIEGELLSERTGRTFPIRKGIPRFVEPENYTGSFGFQWNSFRNIQLDGATGATYSRRRYEAEAGWTRKDLEGKWLLDAGCGAGRFAEIAAPLGPNLVALDYSSAVDAAARTLARFPNADVVQGDLLRPPFRPSSFHFAYCIGVVQHTPDPPAVIANVVNTLAAGGRFAFTIYGRRPWTKLSGKYLVRPVTRRLPQRQLLRIIQLSMPALYPVTSVLFRLPLVGKFFGFVIPVANYPDRREFDVKQRYQETVLDTFDALSPRFDYPMTPCEVETALRNSKASKWTFKSRFPVNTVGFV